MSEKNVGEGFSTWQKNVGVGWSEKNPFTPRDTIKNGIALIATHDIWLGHSKVAKFEVGVNGVSLVDPQWILSETLMGPLGLS